jgi:hypothetical protein
MGVTPVLSGCDGPLDVREAVGKEVYIVNKLTRIADVAIG